MHEDHGRFSAFGSDVGVGPVAELPGGKLYNAPKNNWGPRIAVAWTPPFQIIPGRQTVVRAGFGIYYDTIPLNNFEEGLAQNPEWADGWSDDRSNSTNSIWYRGIPSLAPEPQYLLLTSLAFNTT